ncbi:DUF2009 domain-containing protein [Chloropicon primus]|uniref:DUF2009 domain-containing protein n=2 Tax=Chloropicon primus TaxID=1764295 RepID=A0A5B8MQT8_9CHLO|nr:DUF2009 domain-containing protein [Chloropicon primus]|eukprot:QDZ21672.1 DUF2009 domain-containing protein [Chloropicon primus]
MQKHVRQLSTGSVGWSGSEDLFPSCYDQLATKKAGEDTAVLACWEHGQEEGRERKRWRQVAIKVAKPGSDSGVSENIKREAEILRHLSGQNKQDFTLPISRFYHAGEHQGRAYLCTELLGPSLKQVLEARGRLDEALVYGLGARLVLNLFKVHSCGWVHGSVSPEKILVGRGEDCGNIYLVGLSQAASLASSDEEGRQSTGLPYYSDVTRLRTKQLTRVGDLWSAFYTMLECLVGELPWKALAADQGTEMKEQCLKNPALYVKGIDNVNALPQGLASFHDFLKNLEFTNRGNPEACNTFSYNAVVNKLLQLAGEAGIGNPAEMYHFRPDQIQWPVSIASTLTELSKMAGSKSQSPNGTQQNGDTPTAKEVADATAVDGEAKLTRKGSGMLSGLVQTLSACLTPPSVFNGPGTENGPKVALNAVLDEPNLEDGEPGDAVMANAQESDTTLIAETFYREQKARIEAEVQAKDKEQRLRVAQTQLIEYASQQARDAAHLKEQGRTVLDKASDAESAKLLSMIEQHELEATAFHRQQRSDFEKSAASASGGEQNEEARTKEPETDVGQNERMEGESLMADYSSSTLTDDYLERAKHIPLRLSLTDRRLLRLLEAALNVSEYTDRVDVVSYRSKHHRINQQLRDMCSILCGLVVAQNYKKGKELIEGKEFKDNVEFFQDVFEIGRRHKILNPEKMRSEYGKLLYMLMDSQLGEVQNLLEFKCVRDLRTVYSLLAERGATGVLEDQLIGIATEEIKVGSRTRYEIQNDIRKKEKAREMIARKYASRQISKDEILNCLYSIGDNNSYLLYNRDPIDKMIGFLNTYFKPDEYEESFSLAITGGVGGARLSHSHKRQYTFVLQSLTLWREISHDMHKLWHLAESDILAERNRYTLADTGQGLNRIQRAPSVYNCVHGIISRCQRRIGSWVGSSVVHLGDHNVPNALMFIDKYTQVPKILSPIVLVIEYIGNDLDPAISEYIDRAFGGKESLVKLILSDFFRHGFDGSGADNFFDAGSCIDGRLTSAWNWCSKLEKKAYFPVFKLAGFDNFENF